MNSKKLNFNEMMNENCLKKCNKETRKHLTEDDLCTKAHSLIDGLPVRCVGGWAMQKIFHLIQYFGIFTLGMKSKWKGNINYIEICSGPGRCINRETGDEINGTSLCIIEHAASKYLRKMLFFDYKKNVIDTLNTRILNKGILNAKALHGDYNDPEAICKAIIKETHGKGLNLVFIDPTDCSVPFTLIKRIKEEIKNVDFIINIATRTDVNRNIKNATLSPASYQAVISKYNSFLGSKVFFSKTEVLESAEKGNQMALRKLFREEYMISLKKIGYNFFDFKQIGNFYDLIFATSNEKGIEFWRKANEREFDGQRRLF